MLAGKTHLSQIRRWLAVAHRICRAVRGSTAHLSCATRFGACVDDMHPIQGRLWHWLRLAVSGGLSLIASVVSQIGSAFDVLRHNHLWISSSQPAILNVTSSLVMLNGSFLPCDTSLSVYVGLTQLISTMWISTRSLRSVASFGCCFQFPISCTQLDVPITIVRPLYT